MDTIKELLETKFEDLIVDIRPTEDAIYDMSSYVRPIRCGKFQSRNRISIDHACSELHISLLTRYDNEELYEILCSIIGKIPRSKRQDSPTYQRERVDVKKEYDELRQNVEKQNDLIVGEFNVLISRLKMIGVECSGLLPPLAQYLPDECWEWREYKCYQNCGINICCTKSTELYAYLIDKYKTFDGNRSDRHEFDITELTNY